MVDFEAPNLFRWRTKMMGGVMMTNDKVFELRATDTGTTLVHIEAFSGAMAALMGRKLDDTVPGMLNAMNAALKERIEG